jgi:hypothetical protein
MELKTILRHGLPHAATRVPGLRRLPVLKLLAIGDVASVGRRHLQHLDEKERARLATLLRRGLGTSPAERREVRRLLDKLDVRAFAGSVADRLSPLPLPKRLTGARY